MNEQEREDSGAAFLFLFHILLWIASAVYYDKKGFHHVFCQRRWLFTVVELKGSGKLHLDI